ncbi:MAG: BatA domain-containing protein [Phycisphaerae bacterium]|nr:BatA domain-containing protein [Phycisphaerae bacterium]
MSGTGAIGGVSGLVWGAPGLAVAAVAAVSLPVLIHLLLRRRKLPVEWAAMDLLREAMRRVERRRKLERLLLLATRCLLVACAGLAIAQPIIGAVLSIATAPRTLVVVLDDSIASAEQLAGGGTALEWSASAARDAIDALGASDRVAVVLASRGATDEVAPASMDRRAALSRLANAEPSERGADLPGAIGVAARILDMEESTGTDGHVLVVGAFRAGSVGAMAPFVPLRASSPAGRVPQLQWSAPPAATGANLQVSQLEPVRMPGAGAESQRLVRVTVRRDRGDGELSTTLRITGPTLVAPIERGVRLAAGERVRTLDLAVSERPGEAASLHGAVVATITADAQPQDDSRAAVLSAAQRLRVGIVDRRSFAVGGGIDQLSAGEWVSRALSPSDGSQIETTTTDPAALDARTLAALDAVVVAQPQLLTPAQWELLANFVARGGTVAVLPAQGEFAQAWTGVLRESFGAPWTVGLEAVDVQPPQPLMGDQAPRGVMQAIAGELPQLAPSVQVSRVLPVQAGDDATGVQLSLADGRPFVLSWRPPNARGQLVVFASAMDLAWTTLPVKPLMVPLWQEVVSESARMAAAARTVQVGSDPWIDRPGVVELRPVGADGAPIPGARMVPVGAGGKLARALDRAGMYQMVDAGGRTLGVLAAVVDDEAASVEPSDAARLHAWLGPNEVTVGATGATEPNEAGGARTPSAVTDATPKSARSTTAPRGTDVAVWLLFAAGALVIVESLLSRRFSHARARSEPLSRTGPRVAAGGVS